MAKEKNVGGTTQPCPLKNKGKDKGPVGTIIARAVKDPGQRRKPVNKPLKGIRFSTNGETLVSGPSGIATFTRLPPKTYTVTAALGDGLEKDFELVQTSNSGEVAGGKQKQVDFDLVQLPTLLVKVTGGDKGVDGLLVSVSGGKTASMKTRDGGQADFGVMPAGDYDVTVSAPADHPDTPRWAETSVASQTLASGKDLEIPVKMDENPPLEVVVTSAPDVKLEGVEVKVTTNGKSQTATTNDQGVATFKHVPQAEHTVELTLKTDPHKKGYEPAPQKKYTVAGTVKNTFPVDVAPKQCEVHVKLAVQLPDGSEHLLPVKLPVTLRTDADVTLLGKLDAKGVIKDDAGKVVVLPRSQKFSLEFPGQQNVYVVFEKKGEAAAAELVTDASVDWDSKLDKELAKGKRAFLWLQEDAKLAELDVEVSPADNFAAPKFDWKDKDAIGSAGGEVKILVKPKWQHVRFEYFDRKHAFKDQDKKPVAVPPVLLKGARKTTDGTAAIQTASNFTANEGDAAKVCIAIPWLVQKKANGDALDKLGKDMLLEFGRAKSWIEATAKDARKIIKLDPDDVDDKKKLAPGKDRSKLYDLPKLWRNCFQWTRLSDGTGKFFDELDEPAIEASYDKSKPLTFSLDDIVLVDGTSQAVRDKDQSNGGLDLDKYSRFAILHLDPKDDKFLPKVWKAREKAEYFSDLLFAEAKSTTTFRNRIVGGPHNPRAVLFANDVYDVFDKRTEVVVYGDKQVWGARAAKKLDDDVTLRKKFDQDSDATSGFVHTTRDFTSFFLHYADTDGTTVFDVALTHWSARFFKSGDQPVGWDDRYGPTKGDKYKVLTTNDADLTLFREVALAKAMERWNEKEYTLEQADDKTESVIKLLHVFENKDVMDGNARKERGGAHTVLCGVGTSGSCVAIGKPWMYMRVGGGDHTEVWNGDHSDNDYSGTAVPGRFALAHELGHGAIGLYDDYIVETVADVSAVPTYKASQKYPGMPFNRDESSMMSNNRAVRLRMQWGRALWINAEAKVGGALHKYLAAKKYRLAYKPDGKGKLKYELPSPIAFYKPTFTQANVAFNNEGKADLHLYPLGHEEWTAGMRSGPFTGMLCLDFKIAVDFAKGITPKPDLWASGINCTKGKIVKENGKFYASKETHTANDFGGDGAKWLEVDPQKKDQGNWAYETEYKTGEWVKKGGDKYVVLKDHKAGTPTDKHWIEYDSDTGPWTDGAGYSKGEVAEEGGQEYICKTDHNSSAAFASDGANWVAITGSFNYAEGTTFDPGDEAEYDGVTYVCVAQVKAGTPAADEDDGRLQKVTGYPKDFTATERKNFLVNLDAKIVEYIEGPADKRGRFKLSSTDKDNVYKDTYVRAFPQYMKNDAPPYNHPKTPHFVIKVHRDETEELATSGTNLTIGEKCKDKTIARYLLGLVSNDRATRKNDTNLTADLTVSDLGKLKEWIDGKLGGSLDSDTVDVVVKSFSPAAAAEGATVTITGTGLGKATAVKFGAVSQSTLASVGATTVEVAVPVGATGDVLEVTCANGTGTTATALKILPTVTALAPTTLKVGDDITVTGTSFTGATGLKFGAVAQATFTVASATSITAKVPVGTTTGAKVEVTTPGGSATSTDALTITPPPPVTNTGNTGGGNG